MFEPESIDLAILEPIWANFCGQLAQIGVSEKAKNPKIKYVGKILNTITPNYNSLSTQLSTCIRTYEPFCRVKQGVLTKNRKTKYVDKYSILML